MLGDEERRIFRVRQLRVDSDSAEVEGSGEGSEEDSEGDSEEVSKDGENSEAESDPPQPRHTTRRQKPVDRINDAHELFTFTSKQEGKLSGCETLLTAMTGELRWRRFLRRSARSPSQHITR